MLPVSSGSSGCAGPLSGPFCHSGQGLISAVSSADSQQLFNFSSLSRLLRGGNEVGADVGKGGGASGLVGESMKGGGNGSEWEVSGDNAEGICGGDERHGDSGDAGWRWCVAHDYRSLIAQSSPQRGSSWIRLRNEIWWTVADRGDILAYGWSSATSCNHHSSRTWDNKQVRVGLLQVTQGSRASLSGCGWCLKRGSASGPLSM
ncbi:hypothetical protein Tco_0424024 [Tanacetum coccineum]